MRGQTPAELMLGQNVRIPIAVPYPVGESVLFKPTVKSSAEKVTYVIRAGRNTAFIRTCDERTLLASDNQIAPSGSDRQIICEDAEEPAVDPTTPDEAMLPPERDTPGDVIADTSGMRRSQRERRPNPRYLD